MKRVLVSVLALLAVFPVFATGSRQSAAPASGGTVTLDMFINFTWFGNDKWEGIIPEEITRRTGVGFNVTRAVDDGQLGMMIASGDLPDVIFTDDGSAGYLGRMANNQTVWSLNELIEKYNVNWQPDKVRIGNSRLYNQAGDNNYYFLLQSFSTSEEWKSAKALGNEPTIIVRQDILDALGNPSLKTLADFDRVLGMVKQRYPNMIPYVAGATGSWSNKALKDFSGVPTSDFAEEDGKVKYVINTKNYRAYLSYVNQLYRKGYLMADNFSLNDTEAKALFTNGQAFSLSHCTSGEAYQFGEMAKGADPKAYSMPIALLDSSTKYYITDTGWAAIVIPRTCKDPGAAIKWLSFMWSEEGKRLSQWGREGIEYTMGANGLPVFSQEWMDANNDTNVLYTKYNNLYWVGTDSAWLTQTLAATLPEKVLDVYHSIQPYLYIAPWLGAAAPKSEGEEKNILTKLNDMVKNAEVTCILSENDAQFNQNYNDLMNNAKTIGVDRLEAYMNEVTPKYRAMYQ